MGLLAEFFEVPFSWGGDCRIGLLGTIKPLVGRFCYFK